MNNTLNIVLSGEAGQGLQTIEEFLVNAISKTYYVFSTNEVMSRVRGGNNSVLIRVGNRPVGAYVEQIDLLYLLNNHSFYRLDKRINEKTLLFGEKSFLTSEEQMTHQNQFKELKLTELAREAGSYLFANTLLFGHISGLLMLDQAYCHTLITDKFSHKNKQLIDGNLKAFDLGYALGSPHKSSHNLTPQKHHLTRLMTGNEAVGIGALGGGCNFVASDPMSPGTTLLTYLAKQSEAFDVFVEQAEDEIAALNMSIGAWYTGARALTTTSGGGFALMEEAVSLSGITETPVVTHIAQRPGPGTGLPTRTAQEDLNLAVYAGHGEFARIVLAPGHVKDAIELSQKAFYLADKHQVPVFILTDQYLLESKFQMAPLTLDAHYLNSFVVKSDEDYKRYKLTENGLSPRSIPGYGEGLVKCDSDEHTEAGMLTEDFEVRVLQNDKRLSRRQLILDDYEPAELIGPDDYEVLLVGWGSTYGVMNEFITNLKSQETTKPIAFLYIKQPFPLHPDLEKYFEKADHIINVENNATGQLANLLKLELDVSVTGSLLKYNGVPFSIEDIKSYIEEVTQ